MLLAFSRCTDSNNELHPESSARKGRMTCSMDILQRSSNEEVWILWRAKIRFDGTNGSPKLDFGSEQFALMVENLFYHEMQSSLLISGL